MTENLNIIGRIKEFMENEARSCSMDFGCVTPEYVFRMWGGSVAIEEIANAMKQVSKDARGQVSDMNEG